MRMSVPGFVAVVETQQAKTDPGSATRHLPLERALLSSPLLLALSLACALLWSSRSAEAQPATVPPGISAVFESAGTNRVQLEKALQACPPAQRGSLEFLLTNMPPSDCKQLASDFLLGEVALAHAAIETAPWRDKIPNELFLNDVLPYVSANERREPWRKSLRELALPIVAGCASPSDAARKLNEKLFPSTGVKYSTKRRRADQAPSETLQTGLASCTGLSILLVDACRSVGIPARLAGTPNWIDNRGNHTWVEIWDGDWHFLGAAEPDPNGLDRGWFTGDASRAVKGSRDHAIFATSFRRTGTTFPLVWSRGDLEIPAYDVTDRYTALAKSTKPDHTRVLIRVLERQGASRIKASVRVLSLPDRELVAQGTSRDESSDWNDMFEAELPQKHDYRITASLGDRSADAVFSTGTDKTAVVELALDPAAAARPAMCRPPEKPVSPLQAKTEARLRETVTGYFKASPEARKKWKFPKNLEDKLGTDEEAVRNIVWHAYATTAELHTSQQADFTTNQVRFQQHLSRYVVKTVGTKPSGGWPLFIAMHGGGNAGKQVNDQQWGVMQRYYKDHPEVGGYLYLALRAPNDTWNGFYDVYVYPLIANLIHQFLLFGEVNPDKVFIMGYSHGGYGAFAIGPKIPDRFAAVHASAGAPTDGETSARTLRNTRFTYMIGEKDTAYGRMERCKKYDSLIQDLRKANPDAYPVTMEFIAGNGHTGLPDRDKIADMYRFERNPVPHDLSWELTDNVVDNFYWLRIPAPAKGQDVEARLSGNRLRLDSRNIKELSVFLDKRLADLNKPVEIELNGKKQRIKARPSLRTLCDTMERRGDPRLAFTVEIPLRVEAK